MIHIRVLILIIIISLCMGCSKKPDTSPVTYEYELVSIGLQGSTNITGDYSMFLFVGTGIINSTQELIYTYAISEDDFIYIKKIVDGYDVNNNSFNIISFVEVDSVSVKPRLEKTLIDLGNKWFIHNNERIYYKAYYTFYVPKGSVSQNYNIDVNKVNY